MSVPPYQLRQCDRPSCRFRFPVTDNRQTGEFCPHCSAPTQLVLLYPHEERPSSLPQKTTPIIEALLDNVRSVYNVGSIFRTADGAGIHHLHLCGITSPPNHPQIKKTALGAEQSVAWSHYHNGLDTAVSLKKQGCQLWAIEDSQNATSLFSATILSENLPVVLVVGNEITGVDPDILAHCHRVLHIPMQGQKKSLNVATAFGIAAYFIRHAMTTSPQEPSK